MGLLSVLGKIGAGVAAPFTGGASLGLIPAIDAMGNVLGAGAGAAAGGRRDDASLQAQMNALNNRAMLDAAQFNLGAPGARMGQMARADVVTNARNAPMTGDARIDKFAGGGLRPDLFSDETRQGAGDLRRQALQALLSGSDRVTPQMSGLPKAGMLEKLGGIAGIAGGLAGAAGEAGLLDGFRKREEQLAQMTRPVSSNVRMPTFGA